MARVMTYLIFGLISAFGTYGVGTLIVSPFLSQHSFGLSADVTYATAVVLSGGFVGLILMAARRFFASK